MERGVTVEPTPLAQASVEATVGPA